MQLTAHSGCREAWVQGDGPQLATTLWGHSPGLAETGPPPAPQPAPLLLLAGHSAGVTLPPCQLLRTGHPAPPGQEQASG